MIHKNKYFFIKLPEPAMDAILAHTVEGTLEKARKLYDGSYLVKLPVGKSKPSVLSAYTSFTHSKMTVEKNKREKDRPNTDAIPE